ncbi:MAG TPA: response regulator [Bacteroidales bacterium]|jgi:DNA-binding response OmpR family regulator|nr:response regulator [Bacteroidales bacterium]
MRILYAEDDPMMQKMVVYSLIKMGHEVTTVDNGKEAIEAVDSEKFGFIILDVFMPVVSGLEVAKHIRENLKLETPIIMLSRNGTEMIMEEAKEIGVNDYITKPIEPDLLLLELKKYTGIASG